MNEKSKPKYLKMCVNCLHFRVGQTGFEFPDILDTEYTVFSCSILGWERKEFYLMKTQGEIMDEAESYPECPYWERWQSE